MSVWTESTGTEVAILFLGDAKDEDIKDVIRSEVRKFLRLSDGGGVPGYDIRLIDVLMLCIEYGKPDVADLVLQCSGDLVNAELDDYEDCPIVESSFATTPLEYAVFFLRLDIAQTLIDNGADVDEDALVFVCKAEETIGIVWEDRGPVETGSTLAMAALLIDNGADANHESTPVQHAATRGNLSLVRFLIDMGADPAIRGVSFIESALYTHIRRGNLALAGALKEEGMVLWEREKTGRIWEQFQRL